MLVAEDARGEGSESITPLLDGALSTDTTLRRVAIRGLGRLQRPPMGPMLVLALDDPVPSIRAEAANALSQSVQSTSASAHANADARVALLAALQTERDPVVAGAIAASVGRMPVAPDHVTETEKALISSAARAGGATWDESFRAKLAVAQRIENGRADAVTAARARIEAAFGPTRGDTTERRLAQAAYLAAIGAVDAPIVGGRVSDIRRDAWHLESVPPPHARGIVQGLYAMMRTTTTRSALMADPDVTSFLSSAVRYPSDPHVSSIAKLALAPPAAARRPGPPPQNPNVQPRPCGPFEKLAHSADPRVALAAIDSLGGYCGEFGIRFTDTLQTWIRTLDSPDTARGPGVLSWRPAAHALEAIAYTRPEIADDMIPVFMANRNPFVREYAARVAAVYDDSALLKINEDPDGNVRAAAIAGLSKLRKHLYDRVFIAALESRQYQVVLAATEALRGTNDPAAVPALLRALARLSAERRENSRDERVAILTRLTELGSPSDAPGLARYLTDFDTTVAARTAQMLTKWTGKTVTAHAKPLPIRPEPLAEIFRSQNLELRITMARSAGGGTILVRLFPDEAPATIARVVRLAEAHYYDGLTFHRFVPGFVIQGGSPGANEVVGDAAFMRDELGMRSHDRGTLGISTRGRDTGDAQFFVNLVDNPRLDHDYTVFGEVISGMNVVDKIIEGDVMQRVEVIKGTTRR